MPMFAICRGFQSPMSRWWTLHQHMDERLEDQRGRSETQPERQYGPVHDVIVEPGGVLHSLVHMERFKVNSLHSQGPTGLRRRCARRRPRPTARSRRSAWRNPKSFSSACSGTPNGGTGKTPSRQCSPLGDAAREHAKRHGPLGIAVLG